MAPSRESGQNKNLHTLPKGIDLNFILSTLRMVPFTMAMFAGNKLWQHFEKMLAGECYSFFQVLLIQYYFLFHKILIMFLFCFFMGLIWQYWVVLITLLPFIYQQKPCKIDIIKTWCPVTGVLGVAWRTTTVTRVLFISGKKELY